MSFKIEEVHGEIAKQLLRTRFPNVITHPDSIEQNADLFWKLRVAGLVDSPRCNIPLESGLELYVYDRLLPGMSSWKDYYYFIGKMMQKYDQ
jgi:hypothetical protein